MKYSLKELKELIKKFCPDGKSKDEIKAFAVKHKLIKASDEIVVKPKVMSASTEPSSKPSKIAPTTSNVGIQQLKIAQSNTAAEAMHQLQLDQLKKKLETTQHIPTQMSVGTDAPITTTQSVQTMRQSPANLYYERRTGSVEVSVGGEVKYMVSYANIVFYEMAGNKLIEKGYVHYVTDVSKKEGGRFKKMADPTSVTELNRLVGNKFNKYMINDRMKLYDVSIEGGKILRRKTSGGTSVMTPASEGLPAGIDFSNLD
jgi:hypothetical protein